ncbi:MAG: hypothetical protein ABIC36_01980 [bacterium]
MDNEQITSSYSSDSSDKKEVGLNYKSKWYLIGIIIAIISPFSGVVLGIGFLTESSLKKQGKIILVFSLIWGAVFIWMTKKGYLP